MVHSMSNMQRQRALRRVPQASAVASKCTSTRRCVFAIHFQVMHMWEGLQLNSQSNSQLRSRIIFYKPEDHTETGPDGRRHRVGSVDVSSRRRVSSSSSPPHHPRLLAASRQSVLPPGPTRASIGRRPTVGTHCDIPRGLPRPPPPRRHIAAPTPIAAASGEIASFASCTMRLVPSPLEEALALSTTRAHAARRQLRARLAAPCALGSLWLCEPACEPLACAGLKVGGHVNYVTLNLQACEGVVEEPRGPRQHLVLHMLHDRPFAHA